MGSYNMACCVSGLPIEPGDAIRWLLLTESSYGREDPYYAHSVWAPRSWPMPAVYADYGAIGASTEDGTPLDPAAIHVLGQSLRLDRVRTPGSKPTNNLSFADTLRMVQGNELLVKPVHPTHLIPKRDRKYDPEGIQAPPGVPTQSAVLNILGDLARDLSITSQGYGRIRIRPRKDTVDMLAVLKRLTAKTEYAIMHTKGSGDESHRSEILVRPTPDAKAPGHYRRSPKHRLVRQAMIREDIWQALIKMPRIRDYWGGDISLVRCKKSAREAWSAAMSKETLFEGVPAYAEFMLDAPEFFVRDPFYGHVGLGTMFRLTAREWIEGRIPKLDVNAFLDSCGEFYHLHRLLTSTRYWWRPSYATGSQLAEWPLHAAFNQRIEKVAREVGKKRRS